MSEIKNIWLKEVKSISIRERPKIRKLIISIHQQFPNNPVKN